MKSLVITVLTLAFLTGCQESPTGRNRLALGIGARLGVTLPFSRAHEEEADLMGLKIMARAGFEPGESVRLWQNMADASGAQPLEFLSTHPSHDSRIAALRRQLEEAQTVSERATPPQCL